MSQTTIIAILAVIVVLVGLTRLLLRPKRPPSSSFKCARCGVVAGHTERTEGAWRGGAKRLFCDSCHRLWLAAQPAGAAASSQSTHRSQRTKAGCLSVTIVLVVLPLALLLTVVYA